MFAIRTPLSEKLETLFSYIYSVTRGSIHHIYGRDPLFYDAIEEISEGAAAFFVAPNRSMSDFFWSMPRALFLGTVNVLVALLCTVVFALAAVASPFVFIYLFRRRRMDAYEALFLTVFAFLNAIFGPIAGLFTSVCLFLSPITRLIATVFWLLDANRLGADGETTLTRAILAGENDEVIKAYIDNLRVDVRTHNLKGEMPLIVAIKQNRTSIVSMLLKRMKVLHDYTLLPLVYQYSGLVHCEMQPMPAIKEPLAVALVRDMRYQRVDIGIIKLLIKANADPSIFVQILTSNDRNRKATKRLINLVVEQNDIAVLQVLVSTQCSLRNVLTEALPIAVRQDHLDTVRLLITYGARTNQIVPDRDIWPLLGRKFTESTIYLIQLVASYVDTDIRYELMDRLVSGYQKQKKDEQASYALAIDACFENWCLTEDQHKEALTWAMVNADKARLAYLIANYRISLSDRLLLPKKYWTEEGDVTVGGNPNYPSVLDYIMRYPFKDQGDRRTLLTMFSTEVPGEMITLLTEGFFHGTYRQYPTNAEFIAFLVKNGVETNALNFPIRLMRYVRNLPFFDRTRIMGEGLAIRHPQSAYKHQSIKSEDNDGARAAWIAGLAMVIKWQIDQLASEALSFIPQNLVGIINGYTSPEPIYLDNPNILLFAASLSDKETEMKLLRMCMLVFNVNRAEPVAVAKKYLELQSFFAKQHAVVAIPSSVGMPKCEM